MTVTYTLQIEVEDAQDDVFLPALLVVRRADGGHDDAQDDAYEYGDHRYVQRCTHALEVLLPAVGLDEGLIKFYIEVLPEGQILSGNAHGLPKLIGLSHAHGAHLSLSSDFLVSRTKGRLLAALLEFVICFPSDHSAGMYLSMMVWTVPSEISSLSAVLMASSRAVLPLFRPMA